MDLMNAPRRYLRRNEQDGSILDSARRAHKAPEMQVPFDVEKGKHRPLCHLIVQEINLIRNDIERALREEMKKEMEKQKTQLYASLKIELLEEIRKDITSPIKKSNLEFKDNMMHILKKC